MIPNTGSTVCCLSLYLAFLALVFIRCTSSTGLPSGTVGGSAFFSKSSTLR